VSTVTPMTSHVYSAVLIHRTRLHFVYQVTRRRVQMKLIHPRNTACGSTFDARRAGSALATNATAIIAKAATT